MEGRESIILWLTDSTGGGQKGEDLSEGTNISPGGQRGGRGGEVGVRKRGREGGRERGREGGR